jgi:MFS family permease
VRLSRSPEYRWIVLATSFLAAFAAIGLSRYGYSAILPSMQAGLGLNGAQSGSITSWNLVGYTIMALVGGILAARLGARWVVAIGVFVSATGMLFTGMATNLASASAARLATGLGNGLVLAPVLALTSVWFDARRRGFATGLVAAGSPAAMTIVGIAVPSILARGGSEGWRLAWYIFAAVAALVFVVVLLLLRDVPHEGSAASSRRATTGLNLKAILASKQAWQLGSVYLLQGLAIQIYFTFFHKRLEADLGYSARMAGILYLVLGLAGLASGVTWGGLSDRFGRGRMIAAMFALDAIAATLFAVRPGVPGLVVSALLFGACSTGVAGVVGAACADEFGSVQVFVSLGFVTIFAGLGQAIGPYIGGWLEDVFASLAPSYFLCAGFYVLAVFSALLLRDARHVSGVEVAQ